VSHASGAYDESSVIWVRDSDSIRDELRSGSRLWFWLQLGLGLRRY